MSKDYIVRHVDDCQTVPCPCGSSTRIITREDTEVANIHVTRIQDSEKHYHKNCTEYYYILEGSGKMELDNDVIQLTPGTLVYIPAGVKHRGWGDFRTLIVGVPALEPDDEFFCDETF
ncbi:MAG: cupin domain-containing protein [Planctomycetes bacterium]|nr:cupin domain-containing protein [Planctomycetota bacterium]